VAHKTVLFNSTISAVKIMGKHGGKGRKVLVELHK